MNNLPDNPEACPRCSIGRIRSVKTVFSREVAGHLLSVPNFPAWECDVCHAFMFDPKALLELHQVLNYEPESNRPKPRSRSKPTASKKSIKPTSVS